MTKIVLIHPDADDAEDLQKEKTRRRMDAGGDGARPGGRRPQRFNLHVVKCQRKADKIAARRTEATWEKGGQV